MYIQGFQLGNYGHLESCFSRLLNEIVITEGNFELEENGKMSKERVMSIGPRGSKVHFVSNKVFNDTIQSKYSRGNHSSSS